MPTMDVRCDGDNCWPDLKELDDRGDLVALMGPEAPPLGVALLRGGMESGKASVTFRVPMADGKVLVTETSLELLDAVVRTFQAYIAGCEARGE